MYVLPILLIAMAAVSQGKYVFDKKDDEPREHNENGLYHKLSRNKRQVLAPYNCCVDYQPYNCGFIRCQAGATPGTWLTYYTPCGAGTCWNGNACAAVHTFTYFFRCFFLFFILLTYPFIFLNNNFSSSLIEID